MMYLISLYLLQIQQNENVITLVTRKYTLDLPGLVLLLIIICEYHHVAFDKIIFDNEGMYNRKGS